MFFNFRKFLKNTFRVVICLLALYFTATVQAIDYFVDQNKTSGSSGNGMTDWSHAFMTLEEALAIADGLTNDIIFVAEGTYTPDDFFKTNDRSQTFLLVNGVRVIGGYQGEDETSPMNRDVDTFITTLSGDIGTAPDNSFHVVTANGITDANLSTLDGFTITGGNANMDGDRKGGGLHATNSKLNVIRCTFDGNIADGNGANGFGGGVYITGSLAGTEGTDFIDCVFKNNTATRGGAVAVEGAEQIPDEDPPVSTKATFTNCLIYDNVTVKPDPFTAGDGAAGVYLLAQVRVEMINCTMTNNRGK